MTLEETEEMLKGLEEVATKEVAVRRLLRQLLLDPVRYAHIRAEWYLWTPEERLERDAGRTRAHDAFIDSCNALSRAMQKGGFDNSWRREIGEDRKSVGDFASRLHAVLSLRAR